MYEGTIDHLNLPRGFGFIRLHDESVFFHFKDLRDGLTFDEQLVERRVQFSIQPSAKGPRAIDVRPAF